MIYRCEFKFRGVGHQATSEAIADFKDGFWLNVDREFTKGSDCVFWIPPNAIKYIEKDQNG